VSITPDIEEHRAHLIGVGYRMTGSLADAEDAVQEAWFRLHRLDPDERAGIRDIRGWLTTVVGRLCLDRLRSAAVRKESYLGPWLPEPLISGPEEDDPLATLVRDEDVRMAAMVVLERLTPPQRVAFVLHDALSLPFNEVAEVLGCSPATARQHASRARRMLADAQPPPRAEPAEQRRLLAALAEALGRGDTEALVALLHPDVVLVNDSGGMTPAARRVILGADKVARLLHGLNQRYNGSLLENWAPVLVNGEQGYRDGGRGGAPESVTVLSVRDGLVAAIYTVLNPAKLARTTPRTLRRPTRHSH
jgi:RNA polymerase sigma-70 factor (ECF subfamily)